eukprot:TRINITY_DN11664_c0_g1_i1.p1 TRINITY_DN11664_c0_g1~~TRINITY_DN11664_c0_g1_i1.p1  ORF type:complete len:234 (-),score=27.88 TRINITY_DN11664_c0_g1_i1:285-986(-)
MTSFSTIANRMTTRTVGRALSSLKAGLGDNVFASNGRYTSLAGVQREIAISRSMATCAVRVVPGRQEEETNGHGIHRREASRGAVSPFGFFEHWDPFLRRRNFKQLIHTMDNIFEDRSIFSSRFGGAIPRSRRTPWDVIEDAEGFHLRVDLPGLSKEEVKVSVEDKGLLIKADHSETDDKWKTRGESRSYSARVELPENADLDKIKAELKNGVLHVTVPRGTIEQKVISVAVS